MKFTKLLIAIAFAGILAAGCKKDDTKGGEIN